MSVHIYTNGAWTDSGRIYRNSNNLFTTENSITDCYINNAGVIVPYTPGSGAISGWNVSDYILLSADQTYVINFNSVSGNDAYFAFYDELKTLIRTTKSDNLIFTTPANTHYARFSYRDTSFNIMLNIGSTSQPYEPYNVVDWYTNPGHGYSSGAWD